MVAASMVAHHAIRVLGSTVRMAEQDDRSDRIVDPRRSRPPHEPPSDRRAG
jgi:hypothetical protein